MICTLTLCVALASEPASGLDGLIDELHAASSLHGTVLVLEGGVVGYQRSVGVARADTGEPIDATTRFEVASVAKPLTAVGVMVLVQDGLVALDTPAEEYLPGFPYPGVTVRHLLSHTSGLPFHARFIGEHWDLDRVADNDALLAVLKKTTPDLAFAPGSGFLYSNLNYWTLAEIIEAVSGRPFAAFMQDEVFIPAGMARTSVLADPLSERTAPPGVAVSQVPVQTADGAIEWVASGSTDTTRFVRFLAGEEGGVHVTTTCQDLARLLDVVRGQRVLTPAAAREMITPARLEDGSEVVVRGWSEHGYALGWKTDADGSVWHDGDWGGYRAMVRLNPETGDGLIYTLNRPPLDWSWLPRLMGEAERARDQR